MYFYIMLLGLALSGFNLGSEMNNKSRPRVMVLFAILTVVMFATAISER